MIDHDRPSIHDLQCRWDKDDTTRDKKEGRAKRAFLEQEANQLFAPVEDHLAKLGRVLQAATIASVDVDPRWKHVGDQKLRRVAKVILRKSGQHLPLDLTIEGVTIFYRNAPYRFTGGVEALIPVITSDVERFITAQSGGGRSLRK